jgi:hypothetical protein
LNTHDLIAWQAEKEPFNMIESIIKVREPAATIDRLTYRRRRRRKRVTLI